MFNPSVKPITQSDAPQEARIYLSAPHMSGIELKYIQEALESNWVAPLGPHVDAFEQELAAYLGIQGAVAVNSGTSAIHLALRLLGVERGDRVFCSSLTFVASANPILYAGAVPVFIDSEPDTWNMSPQALARAFEDAEQEGQLPKAVIVVHLYGQPARMSEILSLCEQYGVPVVEDAAESLGSTYQGKQSGTLGKFGIFSFNGNKIITTSGGGMLVSDDADALQTARFLAAQARDPAIHYQHSVVGYNYRMSNILAAIGRAQLRVLDNRVEWRRAIFNRYVQELSDLPGISFMPELEHTRSNRWLTVMLVDESEAGCSVSGLLNALARANIEARPVWKPLHLQPLFQGTRYYPHHPDPPDQRERSVSDYLFRTGICLPSGTGMTEADQMRVIRTLRLAMGKTAQTSHAAEAE
jgi:pyridoxal phosphate-dependent aminotransferase EpsN